MKEKGKKNLYIGIILLVAFLLWTCAVRLVDVQQIGPQNSNVGFATINNLVHTFTGTNMCLYTLTDWLELVPIVFVISFGILGLIQWIKRKHILKVDFNILVLGGFYIVVMAIYVAFEIFVVNYRPVLINGCLEASYPSSTTTLVICVMSTALIQFNLRLKNNFLKKSVAFIIIAFVVFMVLGRLLSGVHWVTDIIGGALISASLVQIYKGIIMKTTEI